MLKIETSTSCHYCLRFFHNNMLLSYNSVSICSYSVLHLSNIVSEVAFNFFPEACNCVSSGLNGIYLRRYTTLF